MTAIGSDLVLLTTVERLLGSVSVPFVVGMALLAVTVGATGALLYRLIMDTAVPWHVPIITGVGAVGLWMNTARTIVEFIERTATQQPLLLQNMATNSAAIAVSGVAAIAGARLGDQVGLSLRAVTGARRSEIPMGQLVQTIGRFISVQVPRAEDIRDVGEYEPVSEETKEEVSNAEFRFPRGLTLDQLHQRVVDRLRHDYGIGNVDLELDEEGTITYLAIGSREAGIGPTLPARRGAISVQATSAPEATPGDRVQVWTVENGRARRITNAELRGASDEVATLVMDVEQLEAIDQSQTYELVTLNSEQRPELEFVSLLRTANERMDSITVVDGSQLVGLPIGALTLPVIAIRAASDTMHTAPPREHVCGVGDTVYVIGSPDEFRKFKTAANPTARN